MVQGRSGIGKDIPPFCIAAGLNRVAGLNVIGLRRAGFDTAARAEVKRAFHLLYRSGRNVSQALEAAATGAWSDNAREFFDFVAGAKRRGICAPAGRTAASGEPEGE